MYLRYQNIASNYFEGIPQDVWVRIEHITSISELVIYFHCACQQVNRGNPNASPEEEQDQANLEHNWFLGQLRFGDS